MDRIAPYALVSGLLDDDFVLRLLLRGKPCFRSGPRLRSHLGLLIGLCFQLFAFLLFLRVVFLKTLQTGLEAAQAFTQTLAKFRKLLAAKEHNNNEANDQQMRWLKQVAHRNSPCRIGRTRDAGLHTLLSHIWRMSENVPAKGLRACDPPTHYTIPVRTKSTAKLNTSKSKLPFFQRLALTIVPPTAALLIRLLGLTLRYQDRAEPGVTPGHAIAGPVVFAFWHRSLLVCAHRFRNLGITILVSSSFDGELITRTTELLGFHVVRGSSTRGGAAGLRAMQQAYADGHRCAITADGPRGPAFVAKPGTALLANSVGPLSDSGKPAGTWVGCFYALPVRAWQLRSWDRFLIPKPFSRVVLTWPAHVPVGEVTTATVQTALDRAMQMAEEPN